MSSNIDQLRDQYQRIKTEINLSLHDQATEFGLICSAPHEGVEINCHKKKRKSVFRLQIFRSKQVG